MLFVSQNNVHLGQVWLVQVDFNWYMFLVTLHFILVLKIIQPASHLKNSSFNVRLFFLDSLVGLKRSALRLQSFTLRAAVIGWKASEVLTHFPIPHSHTSTSLYVYKYVFDTAEGATCSYSVTVTAREGAAGYPSMHWERGSMDSGHAHVLKSQLHVFFWMWEESEAPGRNLTLLTEDFRSSGHTLCCCVGCCSVCFMSFWSIL